MQFDYLYKVLLVIGCLCSCLGIAAAARAMPSGSTCGCAAVQYVPVCAGNIKFPSPCQARCAGFIIFHATKPDRSCSTRRMLQQLDPLSPSDVLISANNTASNGSNSTNSSSKEHQPRGARLDQRFPTLPGIPDLCTCSGMYKPVCGGDDSRLKFSNICSGRCAGYKRFKSAGPDGLCPPKKPTTP